MPVLIINVNRDTEIETIETASNEDRPVIDATTILSTFLENIVQILSINITGADAIVVIHHKDDGWTEWTGCYSWTLLRAG